MNIFHEDFRDLISAFNRHKVSYVLVGGYSVIIHGYRRSTGDMDLLVERTEHNYRKIISAFITFGMPPMGMTMEAFLSNENDVFTFGRPPVAVDIMTQMKGISYKEVYEQSFLHETDGLMVRVIHINHLKMAKKASGRYKDLDDLENLD